MRRGRLRESDVGARGAAEPVGGAGLMPLPDNRPVSNDDDRMLVWPDGSIYTITRSTADTGGELLEMEWELPAHGWAPQPHVHPRLTEEYQVLEGSLEVLVGSEWRKLTAGDAASVPPGTCAPAGCRRAPARVPDDLRQGRKQEGTSSLNVATG